MRCYQILILLGAGLLSSLAAQEFKSPEKVTAADREAELAEIFKGATSSKPKTPKLDRTRGQIIFQAEEGEYLKGEHFGKWNWPEFTPQRWGTYNVELTYVSITAKMGVQFYVGDAKSKGYIPQSGGMNQEHTTEISRIYVADTKPAIVGMLTGDDSNGPGFRLQRVTLTPGPEDGRIDQSIDGQIELKAGQATTFAERMRYEPKPEKNCLGFWTELDDWAEWPFTVHNGGEFELEVVYGCGNGNEGSEMSVWLDDKEMTFTVADTGGFQSWQTINLGKVQIKAGEHVVTAKPKTKANKAVADIHKIVLKPAGN